MAQPEKPRHRSGYDPEDLEQVKSACAHAERHRPIVTRALQMLRRDFDLPRRVGPARAADFSVAQPAAPSELDDAAADAHGYVDDLLRACDALRLVEPARPDAS